MPKIAIATIGTDGSFEGRILTGATLNGGLAAEAVFMLKKGTKAIIQGKPGDVIKGKIVTDTQLLSD